MGKYEKKRKQEKPVEILLILPQPQVGGTLVQWEELDASSLASTVVNYRVDQGSNPLRGPFLFAYLPSRVFVSGPALLSARVIIFFSSSRFHLA